MNKHANCQKVLAFSVATALLLFMAACSFEKPEPTPLTLDALCGDTGEYQLEPPMKSAAASWTEARSI